MGPLVTEEYLERTIIDPHCVQQQRSGAPGACSSLCDCPDPCRFSTPRPRSPPRYCGLQVRGIQRVFFNTEATRTVAYGNLSSRHLFNLLRLLMSLTEPDLRCRVKEWRHRLRRGLSLSPCFLWECLNSPSISWFPSPATSNGTCPFRAEFPLTFSSL